MLVGQLAPERITENMALRVQVCPDAAEHRRCGLLWRVGHHKRETMHRVNNRRDVLDEVYEQSDLRRYVLLRLRQLTLT